MELESWRFATSTDPEVPSSRGGSVWVFPAAVVIVIKSAANSVRATGEL
jgi:hypothetical protein